MLIDRERELAHHHLMHTQGLAAPILGTFSNGYAYGHTKGVSCTPATMAQPDRARQIAAHVGSVLSDYGDTSRITCSLDGCMLQCPLLVHQSRALIPLPPGLPCYLRTCRIRLANRCLQQLLTLTNCASYWRCFRSVFPVLHVNKNGTFLTLYRA
jgi:hypothetical protein